MYVNHSQLILNFPDSYKIWRYMSFKKFVILLSTESLFFCRADKFEDKWEGIFPIKMIQKFELDQKHFPSDDGNTYTACQWQIQKEARSHLINCWHVNKDEGYVMWKIYSKPNEASVAIQSTIGHLKKSFDANSERIWLGEVQYIDFREHEPNNRFFNIDVPNTLKAFFFKWSYFAYEKEIRAVINKSFSEHKSNTGILVKVDLNELLEDVVLSPESDENDVKLIKELKENYNYSFPVRKSDLGMNLYM